MAKAGRSTRGGPSRAGGAAPCRRGPWHRLRCPLLPGSLWQMPQLSARHLRGREELHLAHLVLSFITMGYLWQEGEEGAVKVRAMPSKFPCSLGPGG